MAAKKRDPVPCRIAECFDRATHRGMCHKHYKRWKGNTPTRRARTPQTSIARDPVIALYRAEKRRKIKRDAVKIRHAKVEFERMLAATTGFCGRPRKEAR